MEQVECLRCQSLKMWLLAIVPGNLLLRCDSCGCTIHYPLPELTLNLKGGNKKDDN